VGEQTAFEWPAGDDVVELSVEDLRKMPEEDLVRLANSIVLSPGLEIESCKDKDQLICRILRSATNTFH
jgi:hypothetical protein